MEAIAISEEQFKQMKGKLERKLAEPTGTAKKWADIEKVGLFSTYDPPD